MALSISMTAALAEVLKPGMRIASMGYPDLVAPEQMLRDMASEHFAGVVYRGDSEAICKRHGLAPHLIPDAHSFFKLLGAELDVYDIVQERGSEILCDLNEEGPLAMNEWQGMYDVVLDVGTSEHCFNIAQAVMNMAALVKVGGVIIHENPFNCGNHGFYSLNPTWYEDFYSQNGFVVEQCALRTRDGRGADIPRTKRFNFTAEEVNVFAVARRVAEQPFVFPVQTKYAKLISRRRGSGESDERGSECLTR